MGMELEQEMAAEGNSDEVMSDEDMFSEAEEPMADNGPVVSYQSIHITCEIIDNTITAVDAKVLPSPKVYKVFALVDDSGTPAIFLSNDV